MMTFDPQPPVRFGGSTPKKKSPSLFRGVVSKVGDEVPHRSLQLVDVRADLKALGQLAALFGVSSLQNRSVLLCATIVSVCYHSVHLLP